MPTRSPDNAEDVLAIRVGATAAGLLAGLVVGVILAVVRTMADAEFASGWALLVSTAAGAVIGCLSASSGFALAETVLHFFIGTVGGFAGQVLSPSPLARRWLRWVLPVGTACGLLLLAGRRW